MSKTNQTLKGVLNNLVNPFGITDSSRLDQALKEISELLVLSLIHI